MDRTRQGTQVRGLCPAVSNHGVWSAAGLAHPADRGKHRRGGLGERRLGAHLWGDPTRLCGEVMVSLLAGWAWAMEQGRYPFTVEDSHWKGRPQHRPRPTSRLFPRLILQTRAEDMAGPREARAHGCPIPGQASTVPSAATDRRSLSGTVTKLLRLN